MKHNKFCKNQNQNEIDFVPSPDEVARKAYFSDANQDSLQGHEVQHWLKADAQLLAERKLTRGHGFHNQTKNKFPRQPAKPGK
jgi:Fe-S cluster biosynthesis and repair protein YggX